MKSFIFILVLAFSVCWSNSIVAKNKTKVVSDTARKVISDNTAMIQTAKGFMSWYKANYAKASKFKLTKTGSDGNYQVNVEECRAFLQFLQSSNFISAIYVATWQTYFDDKAKNFKQFPQVEGPPEGFDNDLVLMTQEPEVFFKALSKMKFAVTKLKGKTGVVKILGEWGYDIEMSKKDGKWTIDYIATMNYD